MKPAEFTLTEDSDNIYKKFDEINLQNMKTDHNISIGARRSISPHDVILLTADINYTQVYFLNGAKLTVATSLKILEKRFTDSCSEFFRTHKSYLINLNYVKQFDATGDEVFVQMQNDYRVVVSRRKKRAFENRISQSVNLKK